MIVGEGWLLDKLRLLLIHSILQAEESRAAVGELRTTLAIKECTDVTAIDHMKRIAALTSVLKAARTAPIQRGSLQPKAPFQLESVRSSVHNRAPAMDSTSREHARTPFRGAILFIKGGGKYVEKQNIRDRLKPGRPVLYGSTDICNSEQFVKHLSDLGDTWIPAPKCAHSAVVKAVPVQP
ncbi:Sec1 family domain-containing protein 1 [Porphyridium purpureum]|uniref:Sec1 family domain-containing protein 1 n=1 Tax=Porphyridium purpureum TaxID=35688 RepID=A0A5J4YXI4_PORPP|nr:Sec1 family domain-containing protein 1 [Porphyridium purpureum]|eukprot:POR3753..scf209_3